MLVRWRYAPSTSRFCLFAGDELPVVTCPQQAVTFTLDDAADSLVITAADFMEPSVTREFS